MYPTSLNYSSILCDRLWGSDTGLWFTPILGIKWQKRRKNRKRVSSLCLMFTQNNKRVRPLKVSETNNKSFLMQIIQYPVCLNLNRKNAISAFTDIFAYTIWKQAHWSSNQKNASEALLNSPCRRFLSRSHARISFRQLVCLLYSEGSALSCIAQESSKLWCL